MVADVPQCAALGRVMAGLRRFGLSSSLTHAMVGRDREFRMPASPRVSGKQ